MLSWNTNRHVTAKQPKVQPSTSQDNDDSDISTARNLSEIFALSDNWQVLQNDAEFENIFPALLQLAPEDKPSLVVVSDEAKTVVLIGLGPSILNKVKLRSLGVELSRAGWICYVKNLHELKLSRYTKTAVLRSFSTGGKYYAAILRSFD